MNTNTPNKHFGFSLSLVAAALLAGCGGGGGQPSTPVPGNDAVNQLADVATGAAKQGAQTAQKVIGTHEGGVDGSGNGKQTTGPDGGKQGAQTTGPDGGNQAEQTTAPDGGKHGGQTTGLDDGNQGGQSTAPDDGKQSKPSVGNADDNANTLSAGNDAGNPKTPSKGTGGSTKKAPSKGAGAGNAKVQSGSDDKAAKSRPVRPEFSVDLHGKAVTAVMPLATAETLYLKSETAPVAVPLANALMQVVVHDPEYAARLARANSPLKHVPSLPGQKLSVNIFREFYSNYAEKTANFTEIQLNMFSVLGEFAPFKPQSLQNSDLPGELGEALGHQGLDLPFSRIGPDRLGPSAGAETVKKLAGAVQDMLQQLRAQPSGSKIVFGNPNPNAAPLEVKAVTRAFVPEVPLSFAELPEPDRIESFVVRTPTGSYATFINEAAPDGRPHWTVAADGYTRQLRYEGDLHELAAAVDREIEAFNPAQNDLAAWRVSPGIVMVVYRL